MPRHHQASFLKKQITVDGETVQLNIWDTAGQERFRALGPIYYRDADGALLVYDITYGESLDRVMDWVKELRKMDRNIPIGGWWPWVPGWPCFRRGLRVCVRVFGGRVHLQERGGWVRLRVRACVRPGWLLLHAGISVRVLAQALSR
jgi:hypothetical protein